MEEILKQILNGIKKLKENQANTDKRIESIGERIDAYDKANREEFRQLNRRLDSIS